MIGFAIGAAKLLSSFAGGMMQSSVYKTQARIAQLNANRARNAANRKAYSIEENARQNQRLAAENMMNARLNQRAEVGAVRNAQAGNGFTSEGSGNDAVESAQETLDKYIANMALSASISMNNAWQQSLDTRAQGEAQAVEYEGQAEAYRSQASNTKNSAITSLVIGTLGAAAGAYAGFTGASAYNKELAVAQDNATNTFTKAWQAGDITEGEWQQAVVRNAAAFNANKVDPWKAAGLQFSQMGGMAYDTAASFSPYISAFSADANARKNNWGGMMSILSGNVPYKVPQAGTIFSSYI